MGGLKGAYGVPVVLQCGLSNRTRLELTEGPFIDDGVVVGVVEQAWSDPGLRNECRQCFRTSADTRFFTGKVEQQQPLIEERKTKNRSAYTPLYIE